ncbi:oligosaccharide flippase family protein [Bacillus cereus]|uniref:Oligosaccharide flippase family protein n=1 Tax=Bacillus cereus TaxID=1396 RepID=A0AAW4R666_BACCE|nr:oligosaccharide flippase family protein [Bacillus cereus]MBY0041084.1 oligosaccharide flippase family protein [Bacillus cereus]
MKKNKILTNASYLFVSNFVTRLILAFATILYTRFVAPEDYGKLTIALGVSAVICYFTDAGLTHTFIREGMKPSANIKELISSYLRVRLVLAIILSIVFTIFAPFYYSDDSLLPIIYAIVLPTMFGATLQGCGMVYFQVTERMQFSAAISVLQGITAALALVLGMYFKLSIFLVALMYGTSSMVTGLVSLLLLLRYTKVHSGWNKNILNQIVNFTINGIFIMLIPQLGPILLKSVTSYEEIAFFGAAYKIPVVLYQLPGVIAAAFYPRLFAYGNGKEFDKHRELSHFELKLMSFIGIGISLPFIANSNYWIITLLGEVYAPAGDALAILAFMVILQSISYPLADYLTTKGDQWKRTLIMGLGLLVGIASYIILGSKFGMIGAALAAIITEVTLLIGFTLFVQWGIRLLLRGIIFNVMSFTLSYFIYQKFLITFYPLISLILSGLIYGLIVIIIDHQIRNIILGFMRKKIVALYS